MPIQIFKSKFLNEAAKSVAFRYTRFGAPNYPYTIEPIQLSFLISEIDRLRDVVGNILEIGVARGMTTRFIAEHIKNQKSADVPKVFAIDTFESFTKSDLDYEVSNRGKLLAELKSFGYNDYEIWKRNFAEFPFVNAVRSDCVAVDYNRLSPIKLVFLDVDLYLPTKKTLPKVYDALVSGGTIIVDDVVNNATYDGAYQAFMEFCEENRFAPKHIGNKCGIIHKE
jgi:predicted O-methyltransferase YrrM